MAGRIADGSGAVRRAAHLGALVPGLPRLLTLDYDLAAMLEPWEPPQPFDENSHS